METVSGGRFKGVRGWKDGREETCGSFNKMTGNSFSR